MKKKNYFAFVLTICLFALQLNAQVDSFHQLVKTTDLIIEGEVISQETFKFDGEVFTHNYIVPTRLFKGSLVTDTLLVTALGGSWEDREYSCSDCQSLKLNGRGIYFLNPPFHPVNSEVRGACSINGGSKGIQHYIGSGATEYVESHFWGRISPQQFREKIEHYLAAESQKIGYSSEELKLILSKFQTTETVEKCVEYSIENPKIKINVDTDSPENGLHLEFDIYIRSYPNSLELLGSELTFVYDTTIFGANMVSSEQIYLVKGALVNYPFYELSTTDFSENSISISIQSQQGFDLAEVGIEPSPLIHVEANIQAINLNELLKLDFSTDFESSCTESVNGEPSTVDCITFKGAIDATIKELTPPLIFSFAPQIVRAGVRDMITITGMNFGDTKGRIEFRNAHSDNGWFEVLPNDILSWSDNKIEVYVSSCGNARLSGISTICDGDKYYAGTGSIGVRKDNQSDTEYSIDDLMVRYAVLNSYDDAGFSIPVVLNDVDNGGYWVTYDDNFKTNSNNSGTALGAFKRALDTWNCATKVNFISKENIDPGITVKMGTPDPMNPFVTGRTMSGVSSTLCQSSNSLIPKY